MSQIQIDFAENGFIKPCPHTEECFNYPTGCTGECYWCNKTDFRKDIEAIRKFKHGGVKRE